MIFIHRRSGICVDSALPPGRDWQAVPGHGALFRRRERGQWQGSHAYPPDAPLWHAQGWERVRMRAATGHEPAQRGKRSALPFAFAPGTGAERWVVLVEEVGWETLGTRPGAQAAFADDALRLGVPAEALVARLFQARILALGLPLERALWVLKGPPVSPEDLRIRRKLAPLLALAERLSADLAEAAARPRPELAVATPVARPRKPGPRTRAVRAERRPRSHARAR